MRLPYEVAHRLDHCKWHTLYWSDRITARACDVLFGVYPTTFRDAARRHAERFHRGMQAYTDTQT